MERGGVRNLLREELSISGMKALRRRNELERNDITLRKSIEGFDGSLSTQDMIDLEIW